MTLKNYIKSIYKLLLAWKHIYGPLSLSTTLTSIALTLY